MTFTISADDPRTIRAIEIAADAHQWVTYRDRDGQEAYRVPSQGDAGRSYLVTPSSCDCADFRRNETILPAVLDQAGEPRACKHMLAVRLYRELVRAQANDPRATTRLRRRGHLRVVPRSDEAGPPPSAS
jgi:hypothetical protein